MSCVCPECGSINYKVGIVCCKTKKTICIDCCKLCSDYYNNINGGHGCRFVGRNWHDEKTPEQLRLNRIRAELESKYEKIDYFYQTDRPYIAKRIEAEVAKLNHEAALINAEMGEVV